MIDLRIYTRLLILSALHKPCSLVTSVGLDEVGKNHEKILGAWATELCIKIKLIRDDSRKGLCRPLFKNRYKQT